MRPSVTLALMLTGAPLLAGAETFQPREGCTLVVTIQSDSCYVRNVVTCPEMGDGLLVYGAGKDGTVVATVFDGDGATTFNGPEGAGMLLKDRTDLFSLAALNAAGADTFDYTMAGRNGTGARFAGTTTLTGETVEIDGRPFAVVATRQTVTPNSGPALEGEITALYDRELGLLLTAEVRDVASGKIMMQRRPAEFLFPGEDGALAAEPRIGCEG
ncbi:MAG: hypothetical protein NTW20_01525 [Rhodobacterales bacterium]|nr:hypothetical protein [Rhodobacterales bacterium]